MKTLFLLSLLIFTGCQSTQAWLKAKPLSYQKGYEEGCDNGDDRAGNSTIFKTNNTSSYKTNTEYKKGWDQGYKDCYSDKEFDIMTERENR
jgi:hypothetical protein